MFGNSSLIRTSTSILIFSLLGPTTLFADSTIDVILDKTKICSPSRYLHGTGEKEFQGGPELSNSSVSEAIQVSFDKALVDLGLKKIDIISADTYCPKNFCTLTFSDPTMSFSISVDGEPSTEEDNCQQAFSKSESLSAYGLTCELATLKLLSKIVDFFDSTPMETCKEIAAECVPVSVQSQLPDASESSAQEVWYGCNVSAEVSLFFSCSDESLLQDSGMATSKASTLMDCSITGEIS